MAIVDLHRSDVQTDITGGVEFSFSKGAVNKLFQMMSNYMYSDKEYAVISELAANAVDAHAMVSKHDTPIEVNLPTRLESEFVVRDFGPGMSEQDVYRFLTQYGESSKGDTNDQIGSWGVGSKSPAAVSDSWSVISHHDGKKMHFEVFITQAGIPTLKKIYEGESDTTGLEVRVPVSPNGHNQWVNAAQRAFKHYKVKPVFNTTLHFPVIDYKYEGNGWARHARGNRGGKLMITMREYDLDHAKVMSAIPSDDPCRKLFTGGWQGFDFMFNVGEISLSISREQIQYDDKTLAAITGRLQEVYKQFKDMIVADLNVAKNGVEYRQAVNKWYQDEVPTSFLLYLIDGKHGIKVLPGDISAITGEVGAFKDVACVHGDRSKTINRNFTAWGTNIIRTSERWDHTTSSYTSFVSLSISHLDRVQVVIRDVRDAVSRIKNAGDHGMFYLIVNKSPFPKEVKTVLASTFEKPERQKRDPATVLSECYILNGQRFYRIPQHDYESYKTAWDIVAVKIVNAVSLSMNDDANTSEINFLLNAGWKVVGYKDTKPSFLKGQKEALEYLYDQLNKNSDLKQTIEDQNMRNMFNQAGACHSAMLMIRTDEIKSPKWNEYRKELQVLVDFYKKKGGPASGGYTSSLFTRWKKVCEFLGKPDNISGVTNLSGILDTLKERYPLIEDINVSWYYGAPNIKAVQSYISMVDEKI